MIDCSIIIWTVRNSLISSDFTLNVYKNKNPQVSFLFYELSYLNISVFIFTEESVIFL